MPSKYTKRPDGRYLVQIQTGVREDGKPLYKNIYAKTIRDLEEKAAAFRLELKNGVVVDDKSLTVAQWARHWLATYKSNKSYNTQRIYSNAVDVHIIPAIGHYKLKDIKQHHLQKLLNDMASNGLTRTVEIVKNTLNQIFEQAANNDMVYKNPVKQISITKNIKPQKRVLSHAELSCIYGAAFDLKEKAFVYTLLYTGLRRGEILALRQDDVNLINKTISVNKTLIFKSNQAEIQHHTKTDAGIRIVPVLNELHNTLKNYMASTRSPVLFPASNGSVMSKIAFRRFWDRILSKIDAAAEQSGIRLSGRITPHIFRHTFATSLYYAGLDIKASQYILGHASAEITMDVYTHYDVKSQIKTTDKLNLYFNSVKNQSKLNSTTE